MSTTYLWIGHKKDGRGKSHLWGILVNSKDPVHYYYIFWCSIGGKSLKVHLEPINGYYLAHSRKDTKEYQGYRRIDHSTVESRWPEVSTDINMQFMLEKLSK